MDRAKRNGPVLMKWILGTVALLVVGLIFKLSLLVYAMYVLLGVLGLSRFFSRTWTEQLKAGRSCGGEVFEIGESAEVTVEVENTGRLTVPWLIIEESVPREAMRQTPPGLSVEGERLDLTRLAPGETTTLTYQVTFRRRGYYQLGPVLLETGDVFGLHRRYRVADRAAFRAGAAQGAAAVGIQSGVAPAAGGNPGGPPDV